MIGGNKKLNKIDDERIFDIIEKETIEAAHEEYMENGKIVFGWRFGGVVWHLKL